MCLIAYNRPLGRVIRWPLSLIPPDHVTTIRWGDLAGAKWIVGSSNHGCWLGTFERAKQRVFAQTIQQGDVVYDIGANVGFYTLLAAMTAHSVFSFEPLPRNLAYLRKHIELNSCRNVQVLDVAVSDRNGKGYFQEHESNAMGHLSEQGTLEVGMIALDDLDLPPPSVIKMDIEGGELSALLGARATIAHYRPKIFLATHGQEVHAKCLEFLAILGYRVETLGSPDEILATGAGGD